MTVAAVPDRRWTSEARREVAASAAIRSRAVAAGTTLDQADAVRLGGVDTLGQQDEPSALPRPDRAWRA